MTVKDLYSRGLQEWETDRQRRTETDRCTERNSLCISAHFFLNMFKQTTFFFHPAFIQNKHYFGTSHIQTDRWSEREREEREVGRKSKKETERGRY